MSTHIKLKEADITKQIRDYLKLKRVFHWKAWQGLGSPPGVADIIGIHKRKFLAIEVKGPKGVLSEKQANFLETVEKEGGIAIVARSVEDVMKAIK